jgi:hypothetical protein
MQLMYCLISAEMKHLLYRIKGYPSKDIKNTVLNLMLVEMKSETSTMSSNGEST